MRVVQLQEDDFDEHGRVILANIPKTIASAQNSQIPEETSGLNSSPIYTERSFVQTIIEAVTARKLVPRHQQTNRPLPAVDSAFGVVEFAEIQAWGLTEGWCFEKCVDGDITTPAPTDDENGTLDFAMVTTRTKLIDTFGTFTGMDTTWFDNLTDTPKLNAARKHKGQGGRKHAEPLFCPYEVMQWLADPKRKKGRPLSDTTAWRLLKNHFPMVYNRYSIGDPNAD